MSTDTVELPKVRHFTVDGSKEVEDADVLAPSMAMDETDAERVLALREAAREVFEDQREQAEQAEEDRRQAWTDGDLPKPSELLAEREGRAKRSDEDDDQQPTSEQTQPPSSESQEQPPPKRTRQSQSQPSQP